KQTSFLTTIKTRLPVRMLSPFSVLNDTSRFSLARERGGRGSRKSSLTGRCSPDPSPSSSPLCLGERREYETCWLSLGVPFDQDHICPGGTMPHFARFAIFLAIEPFLSAITRFEFEHHDPVRFPVPFQHFRFAAANDVFPAVLLYGRTGEFFVFFVADRIDDVDFNDDISRHGYRLVKALKR